MVASLFAVPFGVAMALPALRLQGLYLALATMAFAQMAAILFFPQPEILGFDGKPIRSLRILGFDFSQPFHFLGIDFGQDVGTMLFIAGALGVVGVLVVLAAQERVRPPAHRAGRQPGRVRDRSASTRSSPSSACS